MKNQEAKEYLKNALAFFLSFLTCMLGIVLSKLAAFPIPCIILFLLAGLVNAGLFIRSIVLFFITNREERNKK